ncbi:hypothetical protein D9615_006783 [Tricholomella constricta]|uniref:Uncharacterized protein n=1 Tax=Tricholomella constricta TaxID=117010 RepID=A0A8H5H7A3_9AGAR|nr:hypothetical protein D9615_006783 [Tricholomella constricta]
MHKFSYQLDPPPPRSIRFRQPLSPLRLNSITEGCELKLGHSSMPTLPSLAVDECSDAVSIGRPSTHRKSRPLVSILKRKSLEDEERDEDKENDNRFEISVIPYRTSCCRTLVCIEHISDWLHESSSDGHCPSCKAPCSLESNTHSHSKTPATPRHVHVPEDSLSPRFFLQRRHAKKHPPPTPSATSSSSLTPAPRPSYTLFNTDDEAYPDTEHSLVLGSSLFSTAIYEIFIRVTSIASLTLFLCALLS